MTTLCDIDELKHQLEQKTLNLIAGVPLENWEHVPYSGGNFDDFELKSGRDVVRINSWVYGGSWTLCIKLNGVDICDVSSLSTLDEIMDSPLKVELVELHGEIVKYRKTEEQQEECNRLIKALNPPKPGFFDKYDPFFIVRPGLAATVITTLSFVTYWNTH